MYTILPDKDMEIGGLSDCNYYWHAGGGRGGGGSTAGGTRGVWSAAPVESRGESPAGGAGGRTPRLSRNKLKMFHE